MHVFQVNAPLANDLLSHIDDFKNLSLPRKDGFELQAEPPAKIRPSRHPDGGEVVRLLRIVARIFRKSLVQHERAVECAGQAEVKLGLRRAEVYLAGSQTQAK